MVFLFSAPMPFLIGIHSSLYGVSSLCLLIWMGSGIDSIQFRKSHFVCTVLRKLCLWRSVSLIVRSIVTFYFFRQKIRQSELGDAVILDADKNTVHTTHDDLALLPAEIVSTSTNMVCSYLKQISMITLYVTIGPTTPRNREYLNKFGVFIP